MGAARGRAYYAALYGYDGVDSCQHRRIRRAYQDFHKPLVELGEKAPYRN